MYGQILNLVFESVDSGNFGVLGVCTYQIWSKDNFPPPGILGGPSCAEKNLGSVWVEGGGTPNPDLGPNSIWFLGFATAAGGFGREVGGGK